jgi:hypothetical protein
MDDLKICRKCDRYTDPDHDTCPWCGSPFLPHGPEANTRPDPVTDILSEPGHLPESADGTVLLVTRPARAGFVYKYLMALSPVVLVILSVFALRILGNLFHSASSSLTSAVPGSLSPYTTGVINQYALPLSDASAITVLMIAPVGIFIIVAAIGWTMRLTELWAGSVLTLVMSGVTALGMATWYGSSPVPGNYLLLLLQWIAFLVQPFCLVAVVIVLFASEKFRRSITYTITSEGLWIRGGLFKIQEHMIPHRQIGRIVFEQDFFGTFFNYGTLIPQSMTRWGAETSFRGIGASGQKDNIGLGIGFAKGREEGSRYPLDCLFGIPDPKKAQKILTGLLSRHDAREEEQVSYLKKIYETNVAGAMRTGPAMPSSESPAETGACVQDGTRNLTTEGIGLDEHKPAYAESPIIRMQDLDLTETTTGSANDTTIREIPPFVTTGSHTQPTCPPPEPVLDQIKKLAEFRDSGIITEQEFVAKKTELLKRL